MINEYLEDEAGEIAEARPEEELEQYLLFESDSLRIGIRVEYVVETIINYSITHLPILPDYIRGIINLRGEVVPIVDIRRRLGQAEGAGDCVVIILNIAGTQLGILADRVDQMVKLRKKEILPMPSRSQRKLFCGMGTLPDGGTMLVLDCQALLET